MMKNAKLSTKMGAGFGLLIVISTLVGLSGWYGLYTVSQKTTLAEEANKCLDLMNQCGSHRRDFAKAGFEKTAGGESADVKWQQMFNALTARMADLAELPGLSAEGQRLLSTAGVECEAYADAFAEQVSARKQKDAAFAEWGRVGWEITSQIGGAKSNVIEPALADAERAQDHAAVAQWSNISIELDEHVIQPFLLLRVNAVYLVATDKDGQWEGYQKQLQAAQQGVEAWTANVSFDQDLRKAAEEIRQYMLEYAGAGTQYYGGIEQERRAAALMTKSAGGVATAMGELTETVNTDMQDIVARSNLIAAVLTVLGIIVGLSLAVLLTRSITKPLSRAVAELSQGADQVSSAAGQVAQSSSSMAEGANELASNLEETSASIEQITSMTSQNTDNARQASELAGQAQADADAGAEAMGRMSSAIDEIKASADETAGIVKTIEEIAFQTNLLALNAAVEAARAGDAGKGFAVVAEEVRSLAQRAAEAARSTGDLISGAVQSAEHGVAISKEVAESLNKISEGSTQVNSIIAEVSNASVEQTQGIAQINTGVAQMNEVTQANAANSEEGASSAEELSAQAEQMMSVVEDLGALVNGQRFGSLAGNKRANQITEPWAPKSLSGSRGHSTSRLESARDDRASLAIALDADELDDF